MLINLSLGQGPSKSCGNFNCKLDSSNRPSSIPAPTSASNKALDATANECTVVLSVAIETLVPPSRPRLFSSCGAFTVVEALIEFGNAQNSSNDSAHR